MKMRLIACAFGRHQVDRDKVRRIHGCKVGRCQHCRTPMEEVEPHQWEIQRVHDAGLGRRAIR